MEPDDEKIYNDIRMALMFVSLEDALMGLNAVFTQNVSEARRLRIIERFKTTRKDFYEAYMKKHGPSTSDDKLQERSFITPHKKIRLKEKQPPLEVSTSNRFSVLETTDNTEEMQIQASNPTIEAKKPPRSS
ncbi:hypothetical protein JTB14_011584 [Gonioctena quinquepunctata]|nr:hypothetical protein JTB14_011584 [Gonioctena quinquepunctata]